MNIILGNYIKNNISTHIFFEIKWLFDFRKDPVIFIEVRKIIRVLNVSRNIRTIRIQRSVLSTHNDVTQCFDMIS